MRDICGWQLGDSVCIQDRDHDDATHHMVSVHELEQSA